MSISKLTGHKACPRKIYPSDSLILDSYIGVEVELEDVWFTEIDVQEELRFWMWKVDGSLRGERSCELVFNEPLGGVDVEHALDELDEFVPREDVPNLSERCSVHVHLDCRDLDKEQCRRLLYAAAVVEPVLFDYCGDERKDNIFCLPMEESLIGLAEAVWSLGRNNRDVSYANLNKMPRYSSTNASALIKFGSIEFRHHPGEYDKAGLLRWINIILAIKRFAMSEQFDVEDFPSYISRQGPDMVFDAIFPGSIGKALYDGGLNKTKEEYILNGVRRCQELSVAAALDKARRNLLRIDDDEMGVF